MAHRPFEALEALKKMPEAPPIPDTPPPPPEAPEDESSFFKRAMSDVIPLSARQQRRVEARPPLGHPAVIAPYSEDLEALAHLEELVSGRANFDLIDTDEYLEGYIRGIHPVLLEKLRQGHFSVQAHLDLHGLTVREADEAIGAFIVEAVGLGYRCVLLVHGRGLNSKDHIPVLKKRMEILLRRGRLRKHILAFTSARPHDGGAGASYVLLRGRR
ncbi:MAG: Smr/MutS family protein [Proteobacteria bacterium]|nr:Smr/MutS family protein [Pseudomonadota bacterium]